MTSREYSSVVAMIEFVRYRYSIVNSNDCDQEQATDFLILKLIHLYSSL